MFEFFFKYVYNIYADVCLKIGKNKYIQYIPFFYNGPTICPPPKKKQFFFNRLVDNYTNKQQLVTIAQHAK